MAVSAICRWEYRGEGHRSIVVADVNNRRVYRMIKRPCRPVNHTLTHEERMQVQSRELHQLQLIADYVSNVMSPIIPAAFVVSPVLVDIAGSHMAEVAKSVEAMRPAHRKNKEVDPASRSALALPDLCFVPNALPLKAQPPTVSIEIKPKRGFIPTSPYIAKENQIKLEVCKYCLHTSLKLKRGVWTQTSKYCPIDLFSGNVHRMKHALYCLLETPRNNFRICKNGQEIFGDFAFEDLSEHLHDFLSGLSFVDRNGVRQESRCISVFLDLVVQALLWCPPSEREKKSYYRISEDPQPVQHCANSIYRQGSALNTGETTGLPSGCILDTILRIQHLDDLDIEGIILLYKRLKQHFKDNQDCSSTWQLDGPYRKDSWKIKKASCSPMSSVELMVQKIKEFLVSMTVQDCSIMISLQPIDASECDSWYVANNPDQTLVDLDGQLYKFSVGTIDLDPKPFDKIPKYFQQDLDIMEAYRKALMMEREQQSEQS
ncbi:inositol-pentakisphosphate 2-kinase-like isoform X2 [Liolophura sinensis]|uniref:inositol-pentakisphosphate 2-kinase-like isoform X2 n=1 Tax=Liolophura sinensis TaxID=3198878 RepID=UPI0031589870